MYDVVYVVDMTTLFINRDYVKLSYVSVYVLEKGPN